MSYGSQVQEFGVSKQKGDELICSNIHKNVLFVRIQTILFVQTYHSYEIGIGKSRKSRIFIAVRLVFIGFYVVFEVEKQFWTIGLILVLPW